MTLILRESDAKELIDMGDALSLMQELFSYGGRLEPVDQPRRRVGSGHGTLNVMFASVPARDVCGLKSYPVSPWGVNFTVLLYRAATSELLAIVEAGHLGSLRTGAATGVATKHLARQNASTHGIFGAGTQAETQLEAVALATPLDYTVVYARNKESLREFCSRMSTRLGVEVRPADSADDVLECDIVTTATSATQPLFDGAKLRAGTHVNAIGSNFLSKAEVDLRTVARAEIVVVDSVESARVEGGDLQPAVDRGILAWDHLVELTEVLTGQVPGRTSDEEITLFKSHGIASEDVIMADEVYKRAVDRGLGQEVELFA